MNSCKISSTKKKKSYSVNIVKIYYKQSDRQNQKKTERNVCDKGHIYQI